MIPVTINPTSVLCLGHKILIARNPICPKLFQGVISTPSITRPVIMKCISSSSEERETGDGNLKNGLPGLVDQQVEELLNKEENRELLEGLEKASLRVEKAKKELAVIQEQELEAKQMRDYVSKLERRVFEIAECQREILEARAVFDEAALCLSQNPEGYGDGGASTEKEGEGINKDKERWESIKAASISALVGSLVGLPISFTQVTSSWQLLLTLAVTFVSCALFGITFRYTIRRDLDNLQLKTGTSAAFGFVKGLATLSGGPPLESNTGSFLSHAFDGALYVSQSLLIFIFAAVSLDFCFKMRVLSPYPMGKKVS